MSGFYESYLKITERAFLGQGWRPGLELTGRPQVGLWARFDFSCSASAITGPGMALEPAISVFKRRAKV